MYLKIWIFSKIFSNLYYGFSLQFESKDFARKKTQYPAECLKK